MQCSDDVHHREKTFSSLQVSCPVVAVFHLALLQEALHARKKHTQSCFYSTYLFICLFEFFSFFQFIEPRNLFRGLQALTGSNHETHPRSHSLTETLSVSSYGQIYSH